MRVFNIPVKNQTNQTIQVTLWNGKVEGVSIWCKPVMAKTYRAAEIAVYGHDKVPSIEKCLVREDHLTRVVKRFHKLAVTAAKRGGFRVSTAGGTRNVIAGVISKQTGNTFDEVCEVLTRVGGDDWYSNLYYLSNGDRWDVRTIAKAACR